MRLPPSRRRSLVRLGLAVVLLTHAPLAQARRGGKSARELARWLSGRFSSEAQSRLDPDYFDVRVSTIPLWAERPDGPWIYAEHAVPGDPAAPFRRRVYRIEVGEDGTLLRRAYAIPDGVPVDAVSPESLVEAVGCAIRFARRKDDAYMGESSGRECGWDAPGVSHVTTEMTVTADRLSLWDRAFDSDGKQVWGATKGPYLFRRLPEP